VAVGLEALSVVALSFHLELEPLTAAVRLEQHQPYSVVLAVYLELIQVCSVVPAVYLEHFLVYFAELACYRLAPYLACFAELVEAVAVVEVVA
jgi:hypothetical protein